MKRDRSWGDSLLKELHLKVLGNSYKELRNVVTKRNRSFEVVILTIVVLGGKNSKVFLHPIAVLSWTSFMPCQGWLPRCLKGTLFMVHVLGISH